MSRKTNRRQLSPTKLRSSTEQKRTPLNSEIQRIINHAAKLISEYNKNSLEKLLDEDMDNLTKISRLVKASEQTWEKVHIPKKRGKSKRKHKRKRSTSLNQSLTFENDINEMHNKVKSKWPTYLEEENSHRNEDSQNTNNIRHEYSSTFTETHQSRRLSKNELQEESVEINKSRANSGTISKISFEKSLSCSVCSNKSGRESRGKNISIQQKDIKYQYEITIETSETEKFENYRYILVQLNGESNSMADYKGLSKLLEKSTESEINQSYGIIKFTFGLKKYLGSILNINVRLDTKFEDLSWYFDNISVKDMLLEDIYFFSCRRWLGKNSPDKLSQVTLTYTPPFKKETMSLSKSTTEMDKSEELSIKEKKHSFSRSATDKSLSSPVLSQRSNNADFQVQEYQPSENSIFEVIQAYDLSSLKQLCQTQIHIVHVFNESGLTPLHVATICFQDDDISREIFDYLISLNVDINLKSQDGLTPLQVAIINGNLPAVKYIIENYHPDLTFVNQEKHTDLQLSKKEEYQAIAEYLKQQNILSSFFQPKDCQEENTEIMKNVQDDKNHSDSDDSQTISIRNIEKKRLSVRNDTSESEAEVINKQAQSSESTDEEDESSGRMDNDAENTGFMFHKTLPVKKKIQSSRKIDKSKKDQVEERVEEKVEEKVEDQVEDKDDTSSYESDSNTSEVSSGEQTLSPLTPKSHSSDSLSTISNESKIKKSENSEGVTKKPEANNEKNPSSPLIGK